MNYFDNIFFYETNKRIGENIQMTSKQSSVKEMKGQTGSFRSLLKSLSKDFSETEIFEAVREGKSKDCRATNMNDFV